MHLHYTDTPAVQRPLVNIQSPLPLAQFLSSPCLLYTSHIRGTVALTALCDVLLFWDELFYYESFGLFAVLILVQSAATGAAAFNIYNKHRKD